MLYSTIRKKSSAAFMLSPGSFGICVGGFLADKVSLFTEDDFFEKR